MDELADQLDDLDELDEPDDVVDEPHHESLAVGLPYSTAGSYVISRVVADLP